MQFPAQSVVAVGDALLLWSAQNCELRTVDARTGALRATVTGPKDLFGDCNCILESSALGCFRTGGFTVSRPSDGKTLFFRPSKDAYTHWSSEGGVFVAADGLRLAGIDPQRGVDLWTATLPAKIRIVASHDGNTVVSYPRPNGSGVSAFESSTGKLLWHTDYLAQQNWIKALDHRTIAVGGAELQIIDRGTGAVLGAGFPNPAATVNPVDQLHLTPSGSDLVFDVPSKGTSGRFGTSIQVTNRSGRARWQSLLGPSARTVAASDGRVLLQAEQDELRALDADTGAVAWTWFLHVNQVYVPVPGLLVIFHDNKTTALDLTADLPQHEVNVQGHVDTAGIDAQMLAQYPVHIVAGAETITPDAQGNFTLRLRGRGTLTVRADVGTPTYAPFLRVPKGATGKAAQAKCLVGSGVEVDLDKPVTAPLQLSVTAETCERLGF